MKKYEFDAEIIKARGGGAWIEFPYDAKKEFSAGRVKIKATFDGHAYRGSLVSMGGKHIVGVLKDIRADIGKDIGDQVHVVIEQDTEERVVDVPPELSAAWVRNTKAKKAFEKLSYSRRREYAKHVAEAKKAETRAKRAAKTVEKLLAL
ncbi:MAG TPA: DUF1905 domain-containing protein [Actinobacteria bacterium]|nr:DUF1905 domain-containing protein [Actinomycetota bacterium]